MSRLTTPVRRVRTAVEMGIREYSRTPVLLALLVVLPAYLVWAFAAMAPETTAVLYLDGEQVTVGLDAAFSSFTTPMAAALVAGIAGLFLMQSGADTDERLVVAGYRPAEVILARLGLLVGVSAVATTISVGVMAIGFEPAHLAWFALATGLAALTYGMVGVLAGLLLDRLPGVYLILFGSMVDLFLFQNPLAEDAPDLATVLPGHYPVALAVDAGFAATVDVGNLWGALAVLLGLAALATAALYWSVRG